MTFDEQLKQRILILDGAMGTRIQAMGVGHEHFHRGSFASWPVSLVGNNDVLCLTAPEIIQTIHRLYVEAGADIITTNTFSSNRISQHEYQCEEVARDMAFAGARIAREVADEVKGKKIWVAGSMGPTAKSLTLVSDMNQPAERSVDFDQMAAAYGEQAEALLDGGADVLLLETCFDALNTKAALYAITLLGERRGKLIPVMVSATINDRSGRTLTGQMLEAFYVSISHYPGLVSFGLNCSFGVKELRTFAEQLAERVPVALSLHPNAGLPNEMGEYEELPDVTALYLRQMAEAGLLNIAGGCCGTDERHIRAISEALHDLAPRRIPTESNHRLWVSGLEPVLIDREQANFTNVGERTNVAGSRKFARLIAEKKYDEALSVARQQIEGGAQVIDINMDDAMLDSRTEMQTFLRYIANDPAVGRSVLMIDSSDWDTLVTGLKNAQGKCIVNSISLKNGEEDFVAKARELHRLGASVVVMAFDEEGQATTYERKIAIAQRAYNLLTGIGYPPEDVILDVNILSVATGIAEHRDYGRDFIRAVAWIKQHLPYAKTSGGVSNLAFLYHAIRAGLDMAIVNPSMLQPYDNIDPQLLRAVEDVILNTDEGATERLVELAASILAEKSDTNPTAEKPDTWRNKSVEERLAYALSHGQSEHLPDDVPEALHQYGDNPVRVIEEPLMQALEHVGQLFGEGKMFLPQVVKSAKVMKDAVALLQPYMQADGGEKTQRPLVIIATANGDVHDIGKNIVGIVLGCNGFDVHDLGVMVSADTILEATRRLNPCLVGISGLITPSLKEMELLCRLFQQHALRVPIIVGGATTSALHTAVKLAPLYDGLVVYGGNASQTSLLAKRLLIDPEETAAQIRTEQQQIRAAYESHDIQLTPYKEMKNEKLRMKNEKLRMKNEELRMKNEKLRMKNESNSYSSFRGETDILQRIKNEELRMKNESNSYSSFGGEADILHSSFQLIDWRMFLLFWGFKGETLQQQLVNPEAERTLREGKQWLADAIRADCIYLRGLLQFDDARRRGNDIVLDDGTVYPMLRSQSQKNHYLCVADWFDEHTPTPLGQFIVAAELRQQPTDESERLMSHAICARLAEAAAEYLSQGRSALRLAFGYATCPDHSLKRILFDRLKAEQRLDVTLTDHYSIQPSTSICGLLIQHPEAHYFPVGMIDHDQLTDYCRRRGITVEEGMNLLSVR